MTGNEAVARGAWEAGVLFASAYPGTPSTEILENVGTYKEITAEWAPNEKVAMEAAIGASIGGVRSMCAQKHVGLNVAADPIFTYAYMGVTGGMVFVSADDPSAHSSQDEQDNRNYAPFMHVPMLEPSDSQEAYDAVIASIGDLQQMLDEANEKVEEKTYENNDNASVKERYDKLDKSLQDQIDEFTKQAEEANANGTAVEFNENFPEASKDLKAAIEEYYRYPSAALDHYDEVWEQLGTVDESMKELNDFINGMTADNTEAKAQAEELYNEAWSIEETVKKPLDLQHFMKEQCAQFKAPLGKHVKFSFFPLASDLVVEFDHDQMAQAVQMLLNSCALFSPTECKIKVFVDKTSTSGSIRISDNGVGLPEGGEEQIFDPMVSDDDSGLSLFFVKAIVEMHGGTITAENNPSGGSIFTITLPVDEAESAEEAVMMDED